MSSKLHSLERSMEDHFKQLQHQIRDLAVSRASDIPPTMAALPATPDGEVSNLQSGEQAISSTSSTKQESMELASSVVDAGWVIGVDVDVFVDVVYMSM